MALSLSKVSKTFYKGTNDERIALDDVSLELSEGTFAVVIGSNGAGKSTLLNVISGQLPLDAGSVRIDAREMAQEPEHVRAALISRVMQDPQRGTLATMTIEENLALADMRHQGRGLKRALSAQRRERFAQTLAGFGLGLEQRLGSRVGLLSGGQRQVLALAIALMLSPRLLLLDEPSAGLSPIAAGELFDTVRTLAGEGIAVLMVEQNALAALEIADHGVLMVQGEKLREGPARAFAEDPETRRQFLGG